MTSENADPSVPKSWNDLPVEKLTGPILVLGDTDTGKSTLVQWIIRQLRETGQSVSFLDGDPGQSTIGVPGTMTLQRPDGRTRSWFIGSTSPRGNMLSVVTGARRLADAAPQNSIILYDTTGLIVPEAGGHYLKRSLIDLLEPGSVIALQEGEELETILEPLRRREDLELHELAVSDSVTEKSQIDRLEYRRQKYQSYFEDASDCSINWSDKAVWPGPDFEQDQLVGLCGEKGFVNELGLVMNHAPSNRTVTLRTPLEDPESIQELRLGDLKVDPETYEDEIDF